MKIFLPHAALRILSLCLILWTGGTLAQSVVGGISAKQVAITSNFAGEKITIFGNVEQQAGTMVPDVQEPYDIVIVVTGPLIDRVARHKTRQAGIWLNSESVTFQNYPSFKWVLSNRPLADITTPEALKGAHIALDSLSDIVKPVGNGDPEAFKQELTRLMIAEGLFGIGEGAVRFQSSTLFSAQAVLPSNVPNGVFIAQTHLFKNGTLLTSWGENFTVRKEGFERIVGETAKSNPFLYGLICVFLALFTGWLGGVIFRK